MKDFFKWLDIEKLLIIATALMFIIGMIFGGCSQKNFLEGNVYEYNSEDSTQSYLLKFEDDTLFCIMKDSDSSYYGRTPYTLLSNVNGKGYSRVTVDNQPEWWDKNYFDIVKTPEGFYSESGREYFLSEKSFKDYWRVQ